MAEGGGLLNRYRVVKPYRGFESLRLRQPLKNRERSAPPIGLFVAGTLPLLHPAPELLQQVPGLLVAELMAAVLDPGVELLLDIVRVRRMACRHQFFRCPENRKPS